jgi:hypothetical protein
MWENFLERGRQQMTIWRMPTACWIPKATDTHSQYVILFALSQQEWLHDTPQCYVIRQKFYYGHEIKDNSTIGTLQITDAFKLSNGFMTDGQTERCT